MGVKTYWHYFSWIIANNFATYSNLTWYQDMPLYHLLCTKCQGNQITFMVTFTPWWKEEKNEETKPIFWKFKSQKFLVQFSWNLECGVLTLESIFTAKIFLFCWSSMKYVCMKIALSFFSMYSWCGTPVAQHITVCLDPGTLKTVWNFQDFLVVYIVL